MPLYEEILRAYRQGCAEERMDTYLANPGLRVRFDEIEREEDGMTTTGKVAMETPLFRRRACC